MQTGGKGLKKVNASINVTPLVDVSLVLLIVYMVMTSMIRQGIKIEVPAANHADNISQENQDRLITISITEDKQLYFNMKNVASMDDLERQLLAAYQGHENQPIIIKGARNLEYGDILYLMNMCRQMGAAEIKLVAKKDSKTS